MEASNRSIEAPNGSIKVSNEPIEASNGSIEEFKVSIEASGGAIEAFYGSIEASNGPIRATCWPFMESGWSIRIMGESMSTGQCESRIVNKRY